MTHTTIHDPESLLGLAGPVKLNFMWAKFNSIPL